MILAASPKAAVGRLAAALRAAPTRCVRRLPPAATCQRASRDCPELSRPSLRAIDAESRIGNRYESPRTARPWRLRCANQPLVPLPQSGAPAGTKMDNQDERHGFPLSQSSSPRANAATHQGPGARRVEIADRSASFDFRRAHPSFPPLNQARQRFHHGCSCRQSMCSSSRE